MSNETNLNAAQNNHIFSGKGGKMYKRISFMLGVALVVYLFGMLTPTMAQAVNQSPVAVEALNPGIIASKIEELRITDTDEARRIMELNRLKADTIENTNPIDKTEKVQLLDTKGELIQAPSPTLRGRPAFERAVPIPERYRAK